MPTQVTLSSFHFGFHIPLFFTSLDLVSDLVKSCMINSDCSCVFKLKMEQRGRLVDIKGLISEGTFHPYCNNGCHLLSNYVPDTLKNFMYVISSLQQPCRLI